MTMPLDSNRQRQLLRDRRICVIIPAYNNGRTVADVVRRALAVCADVIVVDDGSTDDTPARLADLRASTVVGEASKLCSVVGEASKLCSVVGEASKLCSVVGEASKLCNPTPLTILTHDRNRGKGRALQTGFRKAVELGFSYAITLDADGQHYPEDIPKFLEANRQHPGALIVGSRHTPDSPSQPSGSQPAASRFANKFSNFWFCLQTGRRLPDTQTGYRLYPLRKMHITPASAPEDGPARRWALTSRYEAELELLVFASWHGVALVPIDVHVYYPPSAERVSHFRPVQDFARISLLNTVLCLLAVVYGLPLRLWRWMGKYVRTICSLLFFVFFSLCVFTPAVWLYVKTGTMSERKRYNIHRLLHWVSCFLVKRLGIPGAPFTSVVGEASKLCNPVVGEASKLCGSAVVGEASKLCDSAVVGEASKLCNEASKLCGPAPSPHVIICNHQSHLDLVCLMTLTPRLVFLTNDWVWRNPFYGFIIRQAEYYPVSEGIDALMPRLRSLVERGYSIAIFPEGTRSEYCSILRFHQGAFHIAQQLHLGILPVCLYGPGKVLPKKGRTLHKCHIRLEVKAPISRKQLDAMGDTRMQAQTLRQSYRQWYEDMCNRMETQF